MNRAILMLPLCLLLAAPTEAQRSQKTQKPKDDAVTKKDKAVVAIDKFIKGKGKPSKSSGWRERLTMPPKLTFDAKSDYFWHVKTNKGLITIKLMPEVAPMHVSSTMYLSRTGFYDDLVFHRVISGFMAQGGCPRGAGNGSPGYSYDGEYDKKVKHDRPGLLSMANTGQPRSDGSQFFLTFVPTPHLDMKHTIFGAVVGDGLKVLKELESLGSRSGRTKEPLRMQQTWITVKPKAKATSRPKDEGRKG